MRAPGDMASGTLHPSPCTTRPVWPQPDPSNIATKGAHYWNLHSALLLQLEHEADRIHDALHRAVAVWRNRQRQVAALRKMHDDVLDRYVHVATQMKCICRDDNRCACKF